MPEGHRTCLRCGRRAAVGGWQCTSCKEAFREWGKRDYLAAIDLLRQHERSLGSIADRLDGAGFWAAARAVWRAQEKVVKLGDAIVEEDPGG